MLLILDHDKKMNVSMLWEKREPQVHIALTAGQLTVWHRLPSQSPDLHANAWLSICVPNLFYQSIGECHLQQLTSVTSTKVKNGTGGKRLPIGQLPHKKTIV